MSYCRILCRSVYYFNLETPDEFLCLNSLRGQMKPGWMRTPVTKRRSFPPKAVEETLGQWFATVAP